MMTKEDGMAIADSKTFRSGNREAVRLPRNAAVAREVGATIVRSGDVLTMYPARTPAFADRGWTRCWQRFPCWPSMTPPPMPIGRSSNQRGVRGERSWIT